MKSSNNQSFFFHVVAGLLLLLRPFFLAGLLCGSLSRLTRSRHRRRAELGAETRPAAQREHPPLAKVLTGISLALRGTRADYSHVSWTAGASFSPHAFMGEWVFGEWVLERWNDPVTTLVWARIPMLLLTLCWAGLSTCMAAASEGHGPDCFA